MLRAAGALRQAGRLAEAESLYRRILSFRPDLPDCWYNLAWTLRRLGRFEEALAAYQQALDHSVASPEEVFLNRSVILMDELHRYDDAERDLRAALALNPRYSPALLNLANLHEDRGARGKALQVYEKLLEVDPLCWDGLARYATLKGAEAPDAPLLIDRLNDALSRTDIATADRASIAFALGGVLDKCGAHEAAFDAFAQANRFSRRSASSAVALYDRKAHEARTEALMSAFQDRFSSATPEPAVSAPIFICGMFRSGSTLVEQVLASHPRVTAGGEINVLPALVGAHLSPFPARMTSLDDGQRHDLARNYLEAVKAKYPEADILTDKRPDNFLYVGLIKTLFPDAKIIHTARNPLDNCLSVFFLHLDPGMSYALDILDTAHYLRECRRLMTHWKSLYGDDIIDFDYDEFVREPRPALERLLAFCGLDWDERCMSFHDRPAIVKTASVWQVREPLYQRSSGRWRRYSSRLGPLREYFSDIAPED
ncbi:MAG: TPR/sulfotransferase domain-containing protein [Alphaproteobacteria bacterium]|nr:MAG: TPR/sulfotransferase domain-containing protein [Caulobacteraceae bacterium]TPW05969.1 MAG: TPR/sulfotransferase domain-containing protein [Alphaproteobacteria bacterium]